MEVKRKVYETLKVFDYQSMPEELKELFKDKTYYNNTFINYYPGDGYFKPMDEIKNKDKALRYDDGTEINEVDDYLYESGDDIIGDWCMENGAELCEKVLIKIWW